jgi:L-type amino acid transporter 5
MIPKSGGDYAYISEAFGPLPGFLYLWMALIVIMPAGNAIIALTFANYILQPFYPECDPPIDATRLIAACVICKILNFNSADDYDFGSTSKKNCQFCPDSFIFIIY